MTRQTQDQPAEGGRRVIEHELARQDAPGRPDKADKPDNQKQDKADERHQ